MSGMSPTPGPWRADGYHVRGRHGRMIADVCYTGPRNTPPEEYPAACRLADEANARLIAAAPDMAEELLRLRAIFPAILKSLGSGWCSPDCSVEFMERIPAEVEAVVASLKAAKIAITPERLAELKWNAAADNYNQWCDLGQDERDALVTALEKINELASDATDSGVWATLETIGEISHNAITK